MRRVRPESVAQAALRLEICRLAGARPEFRIVYWFMSSSLAGRLGLNNRKGARSSWERASELGVGRTDTVVTEADADGG
jgi:hypothetical protein